jgi:drug/metabolite transporter (DMT)-like permease
MTFNETAYEEHGPIILGSQFLWSLFFGYASFSSALSWMAFFGFSQIRKTIQKFRKRRHQGGTINEQYGDQLNILQRSYPEVPLWWYLALFIVSFVIVITITACGHMFMPVWTYFIAILTGVIVVVVGTSNSEQR